ncbi:MAG: 50S ribosomal protein L11 [Oscillospiraceae bacterium]|nr:50S ribosomal protein L11 [Oscillospiraceae bacterium]
MAQNKKVKQVIRLQLEAGKATPAPPVGTSLGPTGINIGMVCKEYNDLTKAKAGMVIPVEITVYEDRSYSLVLKTPPAAALIRKAANIEKGSGKPNASKVGSITREQIKEIAEIKLPDLNAASLEAAMSMVEGSAKSMGVEISN